jgi:tetraacyldisaccharide 4'-kinase
MGWEGGQGLVDHIWYDPGFAARLGRAALAPASAIYGTVVHARAALYDHGLLPVRSTTIPVLSVGNITVGGTGKTPVSAWIVDTLRARGRKPGVVLRDYGAGDEAAVHRVLNPESPVVASSDRPLGVQNLAEAGCDVAVLDDGFQHRRVRRFADIVLVSADAWTPERRLLPAGPWRESMRALRRASVVVITRKAAGAKAVGVVLAALAREAPGVAVAVAALVPGELRTLTGGSRPLSTLRNLRVRAVAGVGWPAAFFAQLEGFGAQIDRVIFPDHHRYTVADVAEIRRRAPPGVAVICTLKDAVKLGGLWPREGDPLWYVSQRVEFERGVETVLPVLDAASVVRPAPGERTSPRH